jgi:hypothetical protein
MPDTISHFIHGYSIFGMKGGIYAVLPDILSFGRLFIKNLPNKINKLKKGEIKDILKKPDIKLLDKTDYLLYNIFHSLVIWFIIYYFKRDKEFIPIFLAIFIDTLLHDKSYLPTPIFYPLSNFKFDGIPWNSKKGWIISIIITIIIYKYFK